MRPASHGSQKGGLDIFFYATHLANLKDEMLPRLKKNLADLEDLLNGRITGDNITDLSITTAKLASGAVTAAKTADGVGQVASGTYTGDGATLNRIIPVGFIPRHVEVWKQSTGMVFEAIGSGSIAFSNFMRDAAGVQTTAAADWQGIDVTGSGGFKLGSGAGGGLSNTNTIVYWWVAIR